MDYSNSSGIYPGQSTTMEQYPQSGVNIPQVDAIRRARMASSAPLYGTKPGAVSSAAPDSGGGYQFNPNKRGLVPDQMGTKPMQVAPYMGTKPAAVGAPSGRGLPQAARPAPIVRGRGDLR